MIKEFRKMGQELTAKLGAEHRLVVMYWSAFDNKSFQICIKIYRKIM